MFQLLGSNSSNLCSEPCKFPSTFPGSSLAPSRTVELTVRFKTQHWPNTLRFLLFMTSLEVADWIPNLGVWPYKASAIPSRIVDLPAPVGPRNRKKGRSSDNSRLRKSIAHLPFKELMFSISSFYSHSSLRLAT